MRAIAIPLVPAWLVVGLLIGMAYGAPKVEDFASYCLWPIGLVSVVTVVVGAMCTDFERERKAKAEAAGKGAAPKSTPHHADFYTP